MYNWHKLTTESLEQIIHIIIQPLKMTNKEFILFSELISLFYAGKGKLCVLASHLGVLWVIKDVEKLNPFNVFINLFKSVLFSTLTG